MSPKKQKGNRALKRSLKELKTKARPALNSKELVGIALKSKSPTKAFDSGYLATADVGLAHACRAMSLIKRDYGKDELIAFVSVVDSQRPSGRSEKGEKEMPKAENQNENQEVQESKTPRLPLTHIDYTVAVRGAFAKQRVTQHYKNDADHPVEAVYCFPLPDEASVTACIMQIGQRKVVSEIKEREEARKEYDEAVAAGHHGTLMEQERPNIFTLNVGGIEPGEDIKVIVDVVQRVPWQQGGGRLVLPLVVAPRFIPGNATGPQAGGWSPDTDEVPDASRITPKVDPAGVSYDASIKVMFSPGFRCQLSCPSHGQLIPDQTINKSGEVELKAENILTDRDFVLAYKAISKTPEVSVQKHTQGDETFCLVSVVPPEQQNKTATDNILLLDISGSMHGESIAGLRILAKKLLEKLRDENPDHQAGIVTFESGYEVLAPLGKITDQMVEKVTKLDDRGGTYLGPALRQAVDMLPDSGRQRNVILVTDGQTESVTFDTNGVRVIAAGISSAINHTLLNDLARRTGGVAENFLPGEDFDRAANSLLGQIYGPAVKDIKVEGNGELVGDTNAFNSRPAAFALRFTGTLPKNLELKGVMPNGQIYKQDLFLDKAKEADFAHQVWAREFIRSSTNKKLMVEISLKYGVICRHTSFVAISEKQVPGQKPVRVEIPVNLPKGWDYDAVFGAFHGMQVQGLASMPIRSSLGGNRYGSGIVGARAKSACGPDFFGSSRGQTLGFGPDDDEEFEVGDIDFGNLLSAGFCVDNESGNEDGLMTEFCGFDEEVDSDEISDEEISDVVDLRPHGARFRPGMGTIPEQLAAVLVLANRGQHEDALVELAKINLTAQKAKGLSELERVQAYYFVLRLEAYSLQLNSKVKEVLSQFPTSSDQVVQAWYQLCLKETGRKFTKVSVPSDSDGAEYLAWKLGQSSKPFTGDWTMVP